jgi:hypothetical protein
MFQRFLDATDYWFGYSDDSNIGSYDQHVNSLWLLPMTMPTARTGQGPATETHPITQGQAHPHLVDERRRRQRATGPSVQA